MGAVRDSGPRAGCRALSNFEVVRRRGGAASLHSAQPVPNGPLCVLCEVTDKALVLGSTQPASLAAGPFVRRRSGGGAVYVAPGAQCWVDFFLPSGHALLEADVGRSFGWIGHVWADALREVGGGGLAGVETSAARQLATRWSRVLCFGGLGAGEVTVGGRKVVGISQRRDRTGAWFHSMALLASTTTELVASLALEPREADQARRWLEGFAATVSMQNEDLTGAVVRALPPS